MIAAYPLSVSTGDDYAARLGLVLRTARYVREMTREAVAEGCEVSAETMPPACRSCHEYVGSAAASKFG